MADDKINITYYTDPLCCWSWALEPQWRKFVFQYKDHISWTYRVCGLIPDWNNYRDEVNNVVRPGQLGPLWLEAHRASGMPMEPAIWHKAPPSSSFPACIAVRCAGLQSEQLAEMLLRRIRESVMIEGRNISSEEVLIDVAMRLSKHAVMNFGQFCSDYFGNAGKEAFRKDWLEARGLGIQRFPTILISRGSESTMISGYCSFATLRNALLFIAPQLSEIALKESVSEYRKYWGTLTKREEEEFELAAPERRPAARKTTGV